MVAPEGFVVVEASQIAGSGAKTSGPEAGTSGASEGGNRSSSLVVTALVVAGWYGSNIALTMTNKVLLSVHDFRGPIFLSTCHMVCCSLLSFSASVSGCIKVHRVASQQQLLKIVALAVTFLATITLGNIALRFIPVSFDQAIGATTPAFTALLAFLLFSERESRRTYLTLIPIIVGIIIASGAEPLFNLVGFLAGVAAVNTRALKSVLQGRLLSDPGEKMDSMSLLGYMAPVSVVFLIPLTAVFEPGSLEQARQLGTSFWALLACNSVLAYATNLTNFLVTKHTSALTLQVLGNAKGVVAVVLSLLYFRNPATFNSLFGYGITVTGVALYSHSKLTATRGEQFQKLPTSDPDGPGQPPGV